MAGADLDLAGTSWTVVEISGTPVLDGRAPTLTFSTDGRVAGSGGVNRVFAAYEQSDAAISFGAAGATRMAGPAPMMDQEQRFLTALGAVSTAELADGVLRLAGRDADGADVSIVLVPTAEAAPAPVTISGTVTTRARIALPPGAVVTVTLEDVGRADAPSTTIGSTSFTPASRLPVDFELTAPAGVVADTARRLGLRARVEVDGGLLLTTDTHHPVDRDTAGERHELWLVGASGDDG